MLKQSLLSLAALLHSSFAFSTSEPPPAPEPAGIKVARTVTAKSCNFADVSEVVTSAKAETKVQIPAGICDWGTQSLSVGPGIYLKGAGKRATIIKRTTPIDSANQEKKGNPHYLVTIHCSPGQPNSFSDISLQGNGVGLGDPKENDADPRDNGLKLNGWKYVEGKLTPSPCQDFRVFNAHFFGFGFAAVTVVGDPRQTRGVIFKNDFLNNYYYNARIKTTILGYGVAVYGDNSWPELALGTADNIFIEDNNMSGNRHHVASNQSSRYVFRHNFASATPITRNDVSVDAHGRSSATTTGSRQVEIYGNQLDAAMPKSETARAAIGIRGGDGVIFNNTISEKFRYGIELQVEGSYNGFGRLDCSNSPPDRITSLYIWGNTINTANPDTTGIFSDCPDVVKQDRDYFLTKKPGYTPYIYPHPLR